MIQDFYTKTFEIKRLTQTNDNGILTENLTTHLTIKGKMRSLTGYEILQNEKLNYTTTHRFYCDVYDIKNTDKIYDLSENKMYDIKSIRNPFEINRHLEIDCEYKQ